MIQIMQKNLKDIFGEQPGLDEKSIEFLTRALEKSNLPGFDYLEYKQSLGVLRQMNMDDATAFKSAYATASTMGLTKEKLLSSAQHYKNVLNKEKQQFDKALEKQMDQRVKSKQAEVERLKREIADYQKKINDLKAKIEKSQGIINEADATIQSQKSKIEATKDSFEAALSSILNQINKDIEDINRYITQ